MHSAFRHRDSVLRARRLGIFVWCLLHVVMERTKVALYGLLLHSVASMTSTACLEASPTSHAWQGELADEHHFVIDFAIIAGTDAVARGLVVTLTFQNSLIIDEVIGGYTYGGLPPSPALRDSKALCTTAQADIETAKAKAITTAKDDYWVDRANLQAEQICTSYHTLEFEELAFKTTTLMFGTPPGRRLWTWKDTATQPAQQAPAQEMRNSVYHGEEDHEETKLDPSSLKVEGSLEVQGRWYGSSSQVGHVEVRKG